MSVNELLSQLHSSTSFDHYRDIALQLDALLGNDQWKNSIHSTLYDYKTVLFRIKRINDAVDKDDLLEIVHLLRSGLLRNLAGMNEVKLFNSCYFGTKQLIYDYIDTIIRQIHVVGLSNFHDKIDFFHCTRHSFGTTALVLEGGPSLGLHHLGVMKALFEQKLLPRVICGMSVGSLFASLACIHTDEELSGVLNADGINLKAFEQKRHHAYHRKLTRLLKKGYLMDVHVLEECVRDNIGDLTFEEAFIRTGRILNITVASTKTLEIPRLLNYLTAPNVLIWSAACASAASFGLYEQVDLLAKDKQGRIVRWSPTEIQWGDASAMELEYHISRLAELFNVNHTIISTGNPFHQFTSSLKSNRIIHARMEDENPGIWKRITSISCQDIQRTLYSLVASEMRHFMVQLDHLELLPKVFQPLLRQPFQDAVVLSPEFNFSDLSTLFSNPSKEALEYWILKGEQSVWSNSEAIRSRCAIEFTLDEWLQKLKAPIDQVEVIAEQQQKRRISVDSKRTKSIF